MDKILSVVVPIYKVEQYINKCLESFVAPKELMEQIEVIVVNDDTPGNSAIMAIVKMRNCEFDVFIKYS